MFKKGDVLIITTNDDGTSTEHFNNVVIDYSGGLLKVRDAVGAEIIYNPTSASFVKAQKQR